MFFGIFLLAGTGANLFLIYVVGYTGVGLFTFITGISIPIRSEWINKSFQTEKNYPTLLIKSIFLLAGILMMIRSIDYLRDVPSYNKGIFAVIQGKPTSVEEYKTKGRITGIYVTIHHQTFDLDLDISSTFPIYEKLSELKKQHFIIYYLPHSKWIIDYRIE
ncbi:hypothetical protein ACLM5H_08025 [Fredinandcohnia humi]